MAAWPTSDCIFHRRCRDTTEVCGRDSPPPHEFDRRQVSCHHVEAIADGTAKPREAVVA